MKIYFCDICNESIPLKDINSNRITIEEGKIFCQKCAPKKAGVGEKVPSAVLAVLGVLVLAVVSMGVLGWLLYRDLESARRDQLALTDRVAGQLAGLPARIAGLETRLDALERSVRGLGDDLATSRAELQRRHEALDDRQRTDHAEQKKATQDAIDRLTASVGSELTRLKDRVAGLGTRLETDMLTRVQVLEEKVQLIQDVVTSRGPAPAGEPEDAPPEPAEGSGVPGDVSGLEDREIDAHIEGLSDPDPGKRYSAVIALGRYSGPKVVKALEGVVDDPEDYVRVAVLQALRNLEAKTSIPRIIEALRDEDYFVRVAASGALRKLTGQKMGFDPDGPPAEREARAKQWETWWAENKESVLAEG